MAHFKRLSGTRHTIDPNADTIITLRNHSHDFAVWEDPKVQSATGNQRAVEQPSQSQGIDSENLTEEAEEVIDNSDDDIVVYLVSSRHLLLASGYYRAFLTKDWAESHTDENGMYHLSAEFWDPGAFLILMNIIHTRHHQVPKVVSLEMLAKIAVLVDYYQCRESVEVYSDAWIKDLSLTEEYLYFEGYSRNLILWMCISWVFKVPDIFEGTTEIALRFCPTPDINTIGLPIPLEVTDALKLKRRRGIESLISVLYSWMNHFRGDYSCASMRKTSADSVSYSCGAILLGALMKEFVRLGYKRTDAGIFFPGKTFESVRKDINSIKSPVWWTLGFKGDHYPGHSCSLNSTAIAEVNDKDSKFKGLSLHEFRDLVDDEYLS